MTDKDKLLSLIAEIVECYTDCEKYSNDSYYRDSAVENSKCF